jgi:hypothetical protein
MFKAHLIAAQVRVVDLFAGEFDNALRLRRQLQWGYRSGRLTRQRHGTSSARDWHVEGSQHRVALYMVHETNEQMLRSQGIVSTALTFFVRKCHDMTCLFAERLKLIDHAYAPCLLMEWLTR